MALIGPNNFGHSAKADGFAIKAGTTSVRQLTLTGGDCIISATGSNVYTMPANTGTLGTSVAAGQGRGLYNYVTVSISVSTTNATTFSNIANLSVAVSAGGFYEGRVYLAARFGTSTAINNFCMTYPAMTFMTGKGIMIQQAAPLPTDSFSANFVKVGKIDAAGSGSVIVSTGGASLNVSTASPITFDFIFSPSASGSIQVQAGVSAGTATTIYAGSFIRVWKLN